MDYRSRPELIFGLVGPLGVDLDQICDILGESLQAVGYSSEKIVPSKALSEVKGLESKARYDTEYDRVTSHMDMGDEFRRRVGGGAVATLAAVQIKDSRTEATGSPEKPRPNHAYILKSLKHPDEVRVLKKIYGRSFWLVSAYTSRERRIQSLKKSMGGKAEALVNRDYHDDVTKLGHSVRETFPEGDIFVNAPKQDTARPQINRFVELIFGNTFHTPSMEESGMFHAFASSLRSSSLSRQVGASILDTNGNLISTGTNEVPKTGGGIYVEGDKPDAREFVMGYDFNHRERIGMMGDILSRLSESGWIAEGMCKDSNEMANAALQDNRISGARFMDLTEYGREVHAEMDALVGAAKRHESVAGCTMYCTTFPCHICAKHIVAAGIRTLVFIEPYPKSRAGSLLPDSISIEDPVDGKVLFRPYFEISPRRYTDLFTMGRRKDSLTGNKIEWNASGARPRIWESKGLEEETLWVNDLVESMRQDGLY